MTDLKPCPFCGGQPHFEGPESKDERRYMEMKLKCCATMTESLRWGLYKGLTEEEIKEKLTNSLRAAWNDRALSDVPEIGSTVINDACWEFVEVMPHELPGPIFNELKPALYKAVCQVLKKMGVAA